MLFCLHYFDFFLLVFNLFQIFSLFCLYFLSTFCCCQTIVPLCFSFYCFSLRFCLFRTHFPFVWHAILYRGHKSNPEPIGNRSIWLPGFLWQPLQNQSCVYWNHCKSQLIGSHLIDIGQSMQNGFCSLSFPMDSTTKKGFLVNNSKNGNCIMIYENKSNGATSDDGWLAVVCLAATWDLPCKQIDCWLFLLL